MVNFYENLYEIQKLLWYMRVYPDGNSVEQIHMDSDSKTDSLSICCIRKLMILMKLISENLVKNINLSKQNVSKTLIKCFQETKILCSKLNSKELDEVNGLLKMEQIFQELAKLIVESQLSKPIKTETLRATTVNEKHKRYYQLLSGPLRHFQKQKFRNRQLLKMTAKERKMDRKLSEENLLLSKKLEKIELQRNLESMRHKLMILKEQTLASRSQLQQQKSEVIVRDLTRDLINLEVENTLLKRQNECKSIEQKSSTKIAEVKPKPREKLGINLSIKHFHGINIEQQIIDTKENATIDAGNEDFPQNQKKLTIKEPMRLKNLFKKPGKYYRKQNNPLKIYIYRRKMVKIINNLKRLLFNPQNNISNNDLKKQQNLCRDLKNYLYGLKVADDSLPHEKLESQKYKKQKILKKNVSMTVKLNLLKQNALRNGLGKTFGDRRRELLRWCQIKLKPYGIPMYEFSISWTNGHALCALIHAYCPDIMDIKYISRKKPKSTLKHGVQIAKSLGVKTNFNFAQIYRSKRPNYQDVFKFVQELYYCLESINSQNSVIGS